jgi:hypothetical protein
MEEARRALWQLRSVCEIEQNGLGSKADSPTGRQARLAALAELMAEFETKHVAGKDALDIRVAQLVAAAARKPASGRQGTSDDKDNRKGKCFRCQRRGHIAADCPEQDGWNKTDGSERQPTTVTARSGNGTGVQRK